MIDLNPLLRKISDLAARIAGKPDLRWAVVTGVAPLEIQLDAEGSPLQGTPSSLVEGLIVGDRVQVAVQNNRVVVLGRGTGYPGATTTTRGTMLRRLCQVSTKTSGTQTATTSEVTITGVSTAFTLPAVTQMRVRVLLTGYSSAAGDVMVVRVKDGATTVAQWTVMANSAGAATSMSHSLESSPELAAGAHTLTIAVLRVAGSGTITVSPSAGSPVQLLAEELVLT